MALSGGILRAVGFGILLGFALFAVEFLVSVRFYFSGIVSWRQAAEVFSDLAVLYAGVGGAVGLLSALVSWPRTIFFRVFLFFQLYAACLILLGWGRFPLPTWCYPPYFLAADLVALAVRVLSRRLEPRAPRLVSVLFWGFSYGLLLVMAVVSLRYGRPETVPRPGGPAAPGNPNVVLIVLDTVRADHCSVYGYERRTTPNLEALAEEGTVFERAIAPAPWTVPSHASLFTGKLPGMHGAHQENIHLDANEETLAELFRGAGYHTAAIVNNPFLSPRIGFAQGFTHFAQNWSHMLRRHGFILVASLARFLPGGEDHGAWQTVQIAREFFHRNRDRRFFLFMNFMEAHAPYGTIPAPLRARFRSGPPPQRFGYWMDAALPDVVVGKRRLTDEERGTIEDLYDAGIFYLDRMVDELLNALRQEGLLERTVFVVTSDHGEHLGDHDLVSHFFSLYDPVLHVPLIIRAPGLLPVGARIRETVRLQDLFVTLLEAGGIEAPPRDFSTSLLERPVSGRAVLAEAYRPWFMMRRLSIVVDHADLKRLDRRRRAIQHGPSKLIVVDGELPALYDLASDPEEERNIAAEHPAEVRALREEIDRVIRHFPERAGRFPGFDPVSIQRLRSLGYVH